MQVDNFLGYFLKFTLESTFQKYTKLGPFIGACGSGACACKSTYPNNHILKNPHLRNAHSFFTVKEAQRVPIPFPKKSHANCKCLQKIVLLIVPVICQLAEHSLLSYLPLKTVSNASHLLPATLSFCSYATHYIFILYWRNILKKWLHPFTHFFSASHFFHCNQAKFNENGHREWSEGKLIIVVFGQW